MLRSLRLELSLERGKAMILSLERNFLALERELKVRGEKTDAFQTRIQLKVNEQTEEIVSEQVVSLIFDISSILKFISPPAT